jgi:lipoprotein-anchoring transpeptidase ErfK/SrfK
MSVSDADAWLVAATPTAHYAVTDSAPSACLPVGQGDQALTTDQLAHPYDLGLRLSGDAARTCAVRRVVPTPSVSVPALPGQAILVSRSQQWLWAYQGGQLVFATPVTTGQSDLPTPLGTFHVMRKQSNTTFYSPWPKGSPYYYAPLHIDYALLFRAGGFYIHDAPWRYAFGPGTNLAQRLPDGSSQTGSHGCVDVPVPAGAWLYSWARVGTTVVIADSDAHAAVPPEHAAGGV